MNRVQVRSHAVEVVLVTIIAVLFEDHYVVVIEQQKNKQDKDD